MAKTSQVIKSKRDAKFSTRTKYRCEICGRPRGFIRFFGLCRLCFRKMAHQGKLPGVTKSSW